MLTECIELIYHLYMLSAVQRKRIKNGNENKCVCVSNGVCVCEMNISLLNKYVSVSSCVYQLVNGNLNRSLPFTMINFVTVLIHLAIARKVEVKRASPINDSHHHHHPVILYSYKVYVVYYSNSQLISNFIKF